METVIVLAGALTPAYTHCNGDTRHGGQALVVDYNVMDQKNSLTRVPK